MIIFRNLDEIKEQPANAVVTIGNFDGVHLGHREIFRRVRKGAEEIGGVSIVLTFVPHPLRLITNRKSLRLITPYSEKESLIEASGVDYLVIIPFTERFAEISAADFVSDILVGRLGMKKLVIGYDYAFGRNREGNVPLLRRMGEEQGFEVEVLEPIGNGNNIYSSTKVRQMIGSGDVKMVVSLLGRHYYLDGMVVHGHHRGRGLGFPTANLVSENELIPAIGVYAVRVRIAGTFYDGACNIGSNPTFGDEGVAVEVFVFDFTGDLYGQQVRLFFVDRIRDEKTFPDATALQQAIRTDVVRCREILSGVVIREYHL